ncbi:hypothetical protein ACFOY2_04890 [Nonomuraea purpurea]|uniref:ASCH domain-containing protein n=1 Tax=Nonomuraea purpurea TaxID=1849276 RepID=A0ABV8FXQ5_9ACTN
MKALTVRQPWAFAIAQLGKNVENRTWSTTHRGPLAIHAGAGWAGEEAQCDVAFRARRGYGSVLPARQQKSAVVAVVDVVGVCRMLDGGACDCGPWAIRGQSHWRLANVRPLAQPVSCNGRLSLWDLPADVETAVRMQLDPPVQAMEFCPWCRGRKPAGHVCPAGAVGCTTNPPGGDCCGVCSRCQQAQLDDYARRSIDGSPSDLINPEEFPDDSRR